MSAPKQRAKPKSPPVPSRNLEDALADVKKLYERYGAHATFSKGEIASALEVSATSGPFAARLFSLKEYGLLEPSSNEFKVSQRFMTLNANGRESSEFKTAALAAIRDSETFRELLDEFRNKLPPIDAVARRLEQKRFNIERGKVAAAVLEESMRYAGLIDTNNNVLPIRDGGARREDPQQNGDGGGGGGGGDGHKDPDPPTKDDLRVEVPVGEDRKVVVYYPRDLTADEAKKVGNVLGAIVS